MEKYLKTPSDHNIGLSREEYIKNKIKKYGPITVAEYIAIVSYHDSYGYYKTQKIGDDFTTAPHSSKSFGQLIALQLYREWEANYKNQEITLIELGSGNGDLLFSILEFFKELPIKVCVKIVDNSEHLKIVQQEKLEQFSEKISIEWYENLELINFKDQPIFFIANEFFDALPIHQFYLENNILNEVMIDYSEEKKFHSILSKKLSDASRLINEDIRMKNHQIVEISPSVITISKYMNDLLKKHKGLSLIMDIINLQENPIYYV